MKMSDELVKMARLAQHDDRMSTGALYGDLADRIEELEAKLTEQIEWLKRLDDYLIAAEEREARIKEKLAKAVDALRAFNSFDDLPMPILLALADLTGGKDE